MPGLPNQGLIVTGISVTDASLKVIEQTQAGESAIEQNYVVAFANSRFYNSASNERGTS